MWAVIGLISLIGFIIYLVLGLISVAKKNGLAKKRFITSLILFVLVIVAVSADPSTQTETADLEQSFTEVIETYVTTAPSSASSEEEKDKQEAEAKAAAEVAAKKEAEAKEESVPREHEAALKKALSYAQSMHMSKAGIYDQLTSEYGENFDSEAAQYAIDNIVFDWNENALKKAQSYAESMNMSDSAIYDQLTSEYGEKFTAEEAQYAIDNLE